MFCQNCGAQMSGKFCPECGTPAGQASASMQSSPQPSISIGLFDANIQVINGQQIDLHSIIRIYGKYKMGAIAKLVQDAGISFNAAKDILEPIYIRLDDEIKNLKFKDRLKADMESRTEKAAQDTAKTMQMDQEGTAYCPKCHSTSLSADKKGFGIGKAVVGGFIAGPLGLMAGNINAKKVRITCLKCGHQFFA